MKVSLSVQVSRVANGIVITANSDTGDPSRQQRQLVAKDEPEARGLVVKFLEEQLIPEPEVVKK